MKMFLGYLVFATITFGVAFAVQGPYEQCGGQNWSGGTTCTTGWVCQYSNPYYSQCVQAKSDCTTCAGAYEQCGGRNWTGRTQCIPGWTCVASDSSYSQCRPASEAPATTQGTTPSPVATPATSSVKPVTSITTIPTTKSTTTTTAAIVATSSSNTAKVQGPYDQCGGQNWSGGTSCVAGWTCVYQNPYYSQCLQVASTSTAVSTTTIGQYSSSTTTSSRSSISTAATNPTSSSTTKSVASSSSSSTASPSQGVTYKASFTHYGAGDTFGSPNCNTNTAACGFYTYPGYSAAVSENLYGVGPGAGAGPACGTCWRLVGQTDSSGNRLSNAGTTIIVMVNNLCPANGNPLCAQNGLSGTNQYGANVNFDLCSDSGAEAAFFGNSGVGLAIGTATQVDCSLWSGTVVH